MDFIQKTQAVIVMEALLDESRIPQILWCRVRDRISIEDFILDGALEKRRFEKVFRLEIEYWESRLFRSEPLTKQKNKIKTRSPEELFEYGRNIARQVGEIRSDQTNKEKVNG